MLPLAERPAEPGPRDGAESFRAGSGSGSLDERWARLGVFPSGNGDEDRTRMLPPTGGDDRTDVLPRTGGRPGASDTPWPGEDRTQVLPEAGGHPGPPSRPGPGDGPVPSGGRGGFDAFRKPPAPAAHRPADDAYDSERTTALRVPRPAAAATPAPVTPDAGRAGRVPAADAAAPGDAAVRDPWQEDPGTSEATHDPHEVTVQLDAVQIGAGGVLSRTPGAGAAPEAAPVFVDESGRRNRLYRRIGLAVGLACAGYAVVMVATLLSGNSDAPWMPVPGQEEKPAEQVETTPRPSATDPVPSSGTSLDPGAGTPTPGASDLPGPGASAPVAGGTNGTVRQPDGGAPATTPAGRASSQPATGGGDGGGATTVETPPAGGGTATQPTTPTSPDDTPPPDTTAPTGGGGEAGGTDSLSAPSAGDRPVAAEPAAGADSDPAAAPSPENVL
ncbi:hypothetical protein OIE82_21340 [Streptomyces althioticus]|uniref:Translation initiation factor IF-2 n=2 Tax=Streptomyces althioticus group TaxID=2867194 RepID=A0ABZ1YAT8_9ACTN|nr:hypothetical protein OG968_21370 [Streptomyces althioticus]